MSNTSTRETVNTLHEATEKMNREAEILRWRLRYEKLQAEFDAYKKKVVRACPECERRREQTRIRTANTRRRQIT